MRVALPGVTINDQDDGVLPVKLYGPSGQALATNSGGQLTTGRQNPTVLYTHPATAETSNGNWGLGFLDVAKYTFVLCAYTIDAVSGTSPTFQLITRTTPDAGAHSPTLSTGRSETGPNHGGFSLGPGVSAPISGSLTSGGLLPPSLRVDWNIGGTTPSVTFALIVWAW